MIRSAIDKDAGAIATLSGQLGYEVSRTEAQDRLAAIRARSDGEVFVAESGGTVVGWVMVVGAHPLVNPACAEIGGLVVDEGRRGRGIGRELMAAAEGWAVSMGYASVRLRSNVIREAAHAFYRRLGYSETKRQAVFSKAVASR
jgi:GNAT superfamily N-acetyltransferase